MRLMSQKPVAEDGGIASSRGGSGILLLAKSALSKSKDDNRFIQEGACGKGWKGRQDRKGGAG